MSEDSKINPGPSEHPTAVCLSCHRFSVVLLLVVCAIAVNAWKVFEGKSVFRAMLNAVNKPEQFPFQENQSDKLFLTDTGSENILLKFSGFQPNDIFLANYFRAVYILLPRRVYVAEPGTIINRGPQVLTAPWAPSQGWLDEHRVTCVLEFFRDEGGRIRHQKTMRTIK